MQHYGWVYATIMYTHACYFLSCYITLLCLCMRALLLEHTRAVLLDSDDDDDAGHTKSTLA